jgi:putative ABC transport system substrate-binding protein
MSSRGVRVVIVRQDTLFSVNGREIAQLALKNGMSVVAQMRGFVAEGCLLSYGPVFADLYKRGAHYVDRILKGAKPANLPVEQPTAYELHLNLKTAKALGITIPPSLLVQATGVIE